MPGPDLYADNLLTPHDRGAPVVSAMQLISQSVLRLDLEPLPEPELDPDLSELPLLSRSAEVLRYQGSRLEYALSPNGFLRGWVLLVLRIAIFVGVPCVLIAPLLVLILRALKTCAELFYEAASALLSGLAELALAALAAAVLLALLSRGRE